MLMLLGTTLTASFVDSLNPSAIAQQMVLQAMVKKKKHIWYFIAGMGIANFVLGLSVYYGIIEWVTKIVDDLTETYPLYVYGAEIVAGAVCLIAGIGLVIKTKFTVSSDSGDSPKSPASLSPFSLFVMGAAFCAVELTSALPYFGFLTLLSTYSLALPVVLLFILVYCMIYVLPLVLLYFGYNRLSGTNLIKKLEKILGKISSYVVPVVLSILGMFLLYKGISCCILI